MILTLSVRMRSRSGPTSGDLTPGAVLNDYDVRSAHRKGCKDSSRRGRTSRSMFNSSTNVHARHPCNIHVRTNHGSYNYTTIRTGAV